VAFLLLVWILGQQANARVIALHENANDPKSEGWTLRQGGLTGPIPTYPVVDDSGLGVDAWAIEDSSFDFEGGYCVPLSIQEIADALRLGWKLSTRLRIVKVPERLNFTPVQVLVGNGKSSHFGMAFHMESDGSPLINVGSEHEPELVDLDDLDSGYHLYELEFDPSTNQSHLLVDGTLRASNIDAFPGYLFSNESVCFGSSFAGGQGHANYSLVKYEIVPEPSSLLLISVATFQLLTYRNGGST
jgi:hypothetical protein